MLHEATIDIAAPAEKVFDLLTTPEEWPKFMPNVVDVRQAGGVRDTTGERYVRILSGRRWTEMTEQILRFERPQRYESDAVSNGVRSRGSYVVEPASGGCRVRSRWEMSPIGVMWLFWPLIAPLARRNLNETFRRLQKIAAIDGGSYR